MATAASAELNAQYEYRDIPLDLLDEPLLAERETMDERELADLAMSIKDVGLIEPLVVQLRDGRFPVVAGHRRLLACRIVKYSPVPCRIRIEGEIDHLAILIAENAHRADVNPVEEARFYAQILAAKADNDVDKLCLIVRRNRDFVEDRLLLLEGYPAVVEALSQGRIGIAVAKGLNKCKDPVGLTVLLNVAITQGATARQITEWVRDANGMPPIELPETDAAAAAAAAASAGAIAQMRCVFCETTEHTHMMSMLWVHTPCLGMLLRLLGRGPQPTPE